MKASNAAMLLLTCHAGNVMAAPAAPANANSLMSGSKAERNALPLELVNKPKARDVDMSSDKEAAPYGLDEKEQHVVHTMLKAVLDLLAQLPKDHVNHLTSRGEAVHPAVRQAAAEAEALGLPKHVLAAMFGKTASGPTHPPDAVKRYLSPEFLGDLLANSENPLSTILKAFFDALKIFLSEVKKAKEGLPIALLPPPFGLLPTGVPKVSDLPIPSALISLLPTGVLPTGLPEVSHPPIPSPPTGLPEVPDLPLISPLISFLTGALPTGLPKVSDLPVPSLPTGTLPTGLPEVPSLPVPSLPTAALPTAALPTGLPNVPSLPVPSLPTGGLPTGLPKVSSLSVPSLPTPRLPGGHL